MKNINKIKWIEKTLKKINPELKNVISKKNINLVEDGYIDSLMILRLIFEIEKKTKKKINVSRIDREIFFSIESISTLVK